MQDIALRLLSLGDDRSLLLLAVTLLLWNVLASSPIDPVDPCSFRNSLDGPRVIIPSGLPWLARDGMWWFVALAWRGATAAMILSYLARFTGFSGSILVSLTTIAIVVTPLVRLFIVDARYWAEFEAVHSAAFVAIVYVIIRKYRIVATLAVIPKGLSFRVAILLLIVATVYSMWQQSTYFVRGILFRATSFPVALPVGPEEYPFRLFGRYRIPNWMHRQLLRCVSYNQRELHRGYMIGIMERLLFVAVLAAGRWEALAFLTASKALLRAKELENKEYADYILLGSLASAMPALVAGVIIGRIYLPLMLR